MRLISGCLDLIDLRSSTQRKSYEHFWQKMSKTNIPRMSDRVLYTLQVPDVNPNAVFASPACCSRHIIAGALIVSRIYSTSHL